MKSFKLTVLVTLLAGGFGYLASRFVVCYFQTDVSGVSFLLVAQKALVRLMLVVILI